MQTYRKIVIGATERLPIITRTPAGVVVDLTDIDVTVRILGPGSAGNLIVANAACVGSASGAYYDWDTTGLAPGRYYVQFDFDFGDLFHIEPADPLTVVLVDRLGDT